MHIELPDIFIPYKRYSAAVIESVIEEKTSGAPYEERTRQKICSWYRRVKSHLLGVWQQQVKLGLASPGFIPHLVSLVRAAVSRALSPYNSDYRGKPPIPPLWVKVKFPQACHL